MGSVSVVSMVGSKPRQVVRPRFTARSTFRLPALERFRIGDHPTHRVSCRVHGLETMQPCNNGATNCRSPWIVQWMRMSFRGRWCLHCGLEGRLKITVKPSPNGFIEAITSRWLGFHGYPRSVWSNAVTCNQWNACVKWICLWSSLGFSFGSSRFKPGLAGMG
jgi:hypothetical protein